ncbi:hypothetical protein WN943_023686 [Citrus x changshan-huyou]
MGRTKYYVVFVGWKPGVYDSWAKCHLLVNGFTGNSFKGHKKETKKHRQPSSQGKMTVHSQTADGWKLE